MIIPENVRQAIENASKKTGVSESLLQAFAQVESNFQQNAKSPTNVRGLFQITGSTWHSVRGKDVKYSTDFNEQALTAALLIKKLLEEFNGDRNLTAIAYNAGSGVANFIKRHGGLSTQSVISAVHNERAKGSAGFGYGKEKEVIQYPQKIAEALGEPITITDSIPAYTTNRDIGVSNSNQIAHYDYDDKKPFILNNFAASAKQCASLATIPQSNINKSILVQKIKLSLAEVGV